MAPTSIEQSDSMNNVPAHLGIILDGNRRFARRLMAKPWMGHKWGLEKAREVLQWACDAGIKYVTAYVLSFENMSQRPKQELRYILRYMNEELDNILGDSNHVVHRLGVRVRFIGRLGMLPEDMQSRMRQVEKITAGNRRHVLNIAMAYGGQQEIADAVRQILVKGLEGVIKPSDVNETIIRHHLYTNGQPYPDVIFRTGGERRLSNFLSFQSAYSELIFTDRKWPELSKRDFNAMLREYARRSRHFGK